MTTRTSLARPIHRRSLTRSLTRSLLGLPTAHGNGVSSVPVIYGGGPITEGLNLKPQAPETEG